MELHNAGYNHIHDADFFIDRPDGSGDWLLLILKSEALFTLGGKEVYVPEGSLFLYPEGEPQYYRCMPQQSFANDWLHFAFSPGEKERFQMLDIPVCTPIQPNSTAFFTYCIKLLSDEYASLHRNREENLDLYFWLMVNRISDIIHETADTQTDEGYEMLLTIRNKIYAEPYIQPVT